MPDGVAPTRLVIVTCADQSATPAGVRDLHSAEGNRGEAAPGVKLPGAAVSGAEMDKAPTGTRTVTEVSYADAAVAGRATEPTRTAETAGIRETREIERMAGTFGM